MFLGYALYAVENLDASEIHARRRNAKGIVTPKNCENFTFPVADGTVELSGGDRGIQKSTLMRDQPARGEELSGDLRGSSAKCQPIDEMMTEKPATIFGRSKGITLIVITSNLEFSSTCRRKKHSPYHCGLLTWSGPHIRPWICCKQAV